MTHKNHLILRADPSSLFLFLLLFLVFLAGCGKKLTSSTGSNEVSISSYAPVAPIIRGLATNPVLAIRVYVPPAKGNIKLRKVQCTIDAAGVALIEQLQLYFTDREPLFATTNMIAALTVSAGNVEFPVNLDLSPGLHYIWLSATLKPAADITKKIQIHATAVDDEAGNAMKIQEGTSAGYTKRVAIAVRKRGDDSVNSYRIPGMTITDKGTLVAVYDIRYKNSGDLPGNIDVGLSRSTDGGQTWSPMKVIMDMGAPHENNGVGDPAVLYDPVTKKLWVTALWSKGNKSIAGSRPGLSPDETGQFAMVSSDDDGLTWSAPHSITSQVKDPKWNLFFNGPGNGIAMKDGQLVFAAQYWDENRIPHSTIIHSADHGKTWASAYGPKSNTTESQVIETIPGVLMLNMRDNRGRFRSVATTTDFGKTWVEHPTSYSALQDPVCMGSLVKIPVTVKGSMKEIVFFSNPANEKARNLMTVKASTDLAESWHPSNQTLYDEREGFGYSAISKVDNETIGILYEGIRDLYFIRIPVAEIIR